MRGLLSVLVITAWFGLAFPLDAQPQAVGTLRVIGAWTVDGRRVANDTTAAYDDTFVRIAAGLSPEQRRAARLVVYYSVPGQDPLECSGTDPCASGFRVRAHGHSDPLLARILSYLHPAAEPDIAVARGAPQPVTDGVVLRSGTTLAIGSLLATVQPGSYRIVITARSGTQPAVVANALVTVANGTTNVDAPAATDGLYALQLFDPSTLAPASNVAWFAAAAPPSFDARQAAFARAQAATATWSATPQNRAAAEALLRDLVVALADPAWRP
jgi:hypothetical protein